MNPALNQVAPYAGAWIEINTNQAYASQTTSRSLRGSADLKYYYIYKSGGLQLLDFLFAFSLFHEASLRLKSD